MPTTTFLEPGTDATFDFTFWSVTSGTVASATDQVHTGPRSIKLSTGSPAAGALVQTAGGVLADAGRRISFWHRFDTTPAAANFIVLLRDASNNTVMDLLLNTSQTVRLRPTGATQVNGTTVLSANTWNRITISYTITNTTTFRFDVFLNGVFEASATAGTLTRTGTDNFVIDIGSGWGANANAWYDDIYIDTGSDYSDPGNILVTAKRPFANGTTNGFTGSGTPSGYGSGNARYVNERALNTSNLVSVVGAGSAVTEEYNIEGASVGDVDISAANLLDYIGWVYTKALIAETGQIILNNVTSNISITTSPALFTVAAGSTTYPAGTGKDIGEITSTTVTTVSLYECGIIFAYIADDCYFTSHRREWPTAKYPYKSGVAFFQQRMPNDDNCDLTAHRKQYPTAQYPYKPGTAYFQQRLPPDDACELTAHRKQYPTASYPYRPGLAFFQQKMPPDDACDLTAHRKQYPPATSTYFSGRTFVQARLPDDDEAVLTAHRVQFPFAGYPYKVGKTWITSFNTQSQEEDELLTVKRKFYPTASYPYKVGVAYFQQKQPPDDEAVLTAHRQIYPTAKYPYKVGRAWIVSFNTQSQEEDELLSVSRRFYPKLILPYTPGVVVVAKYPPSNLEEDELLTVKRREWPIARYPYLVGTAYFQQKMPADDETVLTAHRQVYPNIILPYQPGIVVISKYPPPDYEEEELLTVRRIFYPSLEYPYQVGVVSFSKVPPLDDGLDQTGHRVQYPFAGYPYIKGVVVTSNYPPLDEEVGLLDVNRRRWPPAEYPYSSGKSWIGPLPPPDSCANQFQTNPWMVCKPVLGVVWAPKLACVQIAFVGYKDSSHVAEVLDENGHLIAHLKGRDSLASVRTGRIGWVEGMIVPFTTLDGGVNLSSGRLLIYFR